MLTWTQCSDLIARLLSVKAKLFGTLLWCHDDLELNPQKEGVLPKLCRVCCGDGHWNALVHCKTGNQRTTSPQIISYIVRDWEIQVWKSQKWASFTSNILRIRTRLRNHSKTVSARRGNWALKSKFRAFKVSGYPHFPSMSCHLSWTDFRNRDLEN